MKSEEAGEFPRRNRENLGGEAGIISDEKSVEASRLLEEDEFAAVKAVLPLLVCLRVNCWCEFAVDWLNVASLLVL